MTTKSKGWRDLLPVHEAADLFPLMSADELHAYGADNEAILVLQVISGNNVTRENIVINESAVIHGDVRPRTNPYAVLESGVLSRKPQHSFLWRIGCQRPTTRENGRVICR